MCAETPALRGPAPSFILGFTLVRLLPGDGQEWGGQEAGLTSAPLKTMTGGFSLGGMAGWVHLFSLLFHFFILWVIPQDQWT